PISLDVLKQKLNNLKGQAIDSNNCDQKTSLYKQIERNERKVLKKQIEKFNLGNGNRFKDPIDAAGYLLKREYGESSLFDKSRNLPIFIPPVFKSIQFNKSTDTPILDYDIKSALINSLKNLEINEPEHWFTKELKKFIDTNKISDDKSSVLNKNNYDDWMSNVKLMYMLEHKRSKLSSTLSPAEFDKRLRELLPLSVLKGESKKEIQKEVREFIRKNPPENDPEMKTLFNFDLSEIAEKVDRWLFDKLWSSTTQLEDTVVLCNTPFNTDIIGSMQAEFDFLIFCWKRKVIIGIECKRTLTDSAFAQLEKYHELLEQKLGDQLGSGWKFWPTVCVEHKEIDIVNNHYISMKTDIENWLTAVLNQHFLTSERDIVTSKSQVRNVLKIIIFIAHSNKDKPIIESNWVDYVSKSIDKCAASSILFYSTNQLHALGSTNAYKKLLIKGGFGTGKTVLLHDKALRCIKTEEYFGRVTYVCLSHPPKSLQSLLYHRSKKALAEKVAVHEIKADADITKRYEELHTIIDQGTKALFLDEWDIHEKSSEEDNIIHQVEVEKLLKKLDILWIAPSAPSQRKMKLPDNLTLDGFEVLDLEYNLRNSKEIVKVTSEIAKKDDQYCYKELLAETPPNFPTGCRPKYVKTIEEGIKMARKVNKRGGILVNVDPTDVKDDLINFMENNKKHFKTYFYEKSEDFEEALKRRYLVTKSRYGIKRDKSPYDCLRDGHILITDNSHIQGFDWPTVICIQQSPQERNAKHKCNYFLRCTTNLIVVHHI
uniref:Uncharacterized protein n=2 Tax=Clytia hemisphaerica TaxID=252671 RepID=A0A7M6DQ13_9CNID